MLAMHRFVLLLEQMKLRCRAGRYRTFELAIVQEQSGAAAAVASAGGEAATAAQVPAGATQQPAGLRPSAQDGEVQEGSALPPLGALLGQPVRNIPMMAPLPRDTLSDAAGAATGLIGGAGSRGGGQAPAAQTRSVQRLAANLTLLRRQASRTRIDRELSHINNVAARIEACIKSFCPVLAAEAAPGDDGQAPAHFYERVKQEMVLDIVHAALQAGDDVLKVRGTLNMHTFRAWLGLSCACSRARLLLRCTRNFGANTKRTMCWPDQSAFFRLRACAVPSCAMRNLGHVQHRFLCVHVMPYRTIQQGYINNLQEPGVPINGEHSWPQVLLEMHTLHHTVRDAM